MLKEKTLMISQKMYGKVFQTGYDFVYVKDMDALFAKIVADKDVTEKDEEEKNEIEVEIDDMLIEEHAKLMKELMKTIDKIKGIGRTAGSFTNVFTNTSYYEPKDNMTDEEVEKVTSKVSIILSVMTNLGMVIAVLVPAVLGVKYMLGSVEEKAEFKKSLIPYLVGAILLFGICAIVRALQQFGTSINNI